MAKKEEVKLANLCDICRTTCSSALQLCEHVVGNKHRANARRFCPASVPHIYKLQYFFDTYMKREPLVGLEYVEEIQATSKYKYTCQLCTFYGSRKSALLHVTGPEHIEAYIVKHHPKLSVHAAMYPQKKEYVKALQQAAAKICKLYGKEIIKETVVRSTPLKMAKYDSDVEIAIVNDRSGEPHVKPRCQESKKDQCGFSGNSDFLDYLRKFEIRSEEDAGILQQITRNCTQALVRYWHDQAQLNELPVKAPGAQGDVTELFFNSIKNMEESEVVDTLHKISATTPAFRGIVIPNVIKYLQATGRMKPS